MPLVKQIVDSFWEMADCIGHMPGYVPCARFIERALDDIAAGFFLGFAIALWLILPTLPIAVVLIFVART